MTHCQFSVQFGDARLVSIRGQTPELSVTVVGRTAAQRAKMQALAEKWMQAPTVEDFAKYMTDFHRLAEGPWRSCVKPDPPSAIAYRFTLTPLNDRTPRRKIGFRRNRDHVRPFDKTKPTADVGKNPTGS
jgi:hypothetical protein